MHPRSPICLPCDFCRTQNLKLITENSFTPAPLAFENRQFLPSRAQSHSQAPVTPLFPFFLRPEQRATDGSAVAFLRFVFDSSVRVVRGPGDHIPAFLPTRPGSAIRQSLPGPISLRLSSTGIRSAWRRGHHFHRPL